MVYNGNGRNGICISTNTINYGNGNDNLLCKPNLSSWLRKPQSFYCRDNKRFAVCTYSDNELVHLLPRCDCHSFECDGYIVEMVYNGNGRNRLFYCTDAVNYYSGNDNLLCKPDKRLWV